MSKIKSQEVKWKLKNYFKKFKLKEIQNYEKKREKNEVKTSVWPMNKVLERGPARSSPIARALMFFLR
jgi:hypothetical protein